MPFVSMLLVLACTTPGDPVPEDLEGLFHYLWAERLAGSDEDLATAVANVDALVEAATLETPFTGRTEPLTDEEILTAGLDREVDPVEAVGMTLVNPFACELDVAAELLQNQVARVGSGREHTLESKFHGCGWTFIAF